MKNIHIDFVSDVACPWCAVGLGSLEQAMEQLKDEIQINLVFHPFELNPHMPAEGQDTIEHLVKKYGSTKEQMAANQLQIKQRAKEAGFEFHEQVRPRVYNTFNCHRLIHWALVEHDAAAQYRLKREFLKSYFTLNLNVSDEQVILDAVERAGLPVDSAKRVLHSEQYVQDIKQSIEYYQSLGISAVPSVIVNDQYLIQGGQPSHVFVDALRRIAQESNEPH
jgi:predicted DsbA family dithiol-disulfide isomerase